MWPNFVAFFLFTLSFPPQPHQNLNRKIVWLADRLRIQHTKEY